MSGPAPADESRPGQAPAATAVLCALVLFAGLEEVVAQGSAAPAVPGQAAGGRIKGTVVGPDRRPVVAACIVARVRLGDRDGLFLTASNDAGTYIYEDLPAGLYRLDAHAEGYLTSSFLDVEVRPPFRNILDFRMQPGDEASVPPATDRPLAPPGEVAGLVLADGTPVPDAEITLDGGTGPGRRMVLTRSDGTFTVFGVPSATYIMSVTAPGSIPIKVPEVTVEPGRSLEVRVSLVDYPVDLAVQQLVVLPREEPLPPRHWWQVPARPLEEPEP